VRKLQFDSADATLAALQPDSFSERANGAILGAMAADACGSYWDDEPRSLCGQDVAICLRTPGGGPHNTAPGQITDNSELAMCQMWAILKSSVGVAHTDNQVLDFNCLAECYGRWYRSNPADICKAFKTSFKVFANESATASDAFNAASANRDLLCNCSMARMTPLAVWGAGLVQAENFQDLKSLVSADSSFVYPNPVVHDCCFLYCAAVGHLLNNPGSKTRAADAFNLACKLAESDLTSANDG